MKTFDDREDVEEWLAPLGYDAFWTQTEPFALDVQPRANCDAQIASGEIDEATVLFVLKGMARLELVERYALGPRDTAPWLSLH
jgi:hypothetical protein